MTRWFSPTAPVNRPRPTTLQKAAESDQIIAAFKASGVFALSASAWTTTLFFAGAGTTLRDVKVGYKPDGTPISWAPKYTARIPIPGDAFPDPSSDAHISVIRSDLSPQPWWEMWMAAKHPDGSWSCGTLGARASLYGDSGVYDGATTGSGFSVLAGKIRASELMRAIAGGVGLGHALTAGVPNALGYVAPALRTDHPGTPSGGQIPYGARVFLNPDVPLAGLPPWQQAIGRTLVRWGFYITDAGGHVGVSAINSASPSIVKLGGYPWGPGDASLPVSWFDHMVVASW